jgi:hypothetical protein
MSGHASQHFCAILRCVAEPPQLDDFSIGIRANDATKHQNEELTYADTELQDRSIHDYGTAQSELPMVTCLDILACACPHFESNMSSWEVKGLQYRSRTKRSRCTQRGTILHTDFRTPLTGHQSCQLYPDIKRSMGAPFFIKPLTSHAAHPRQCLHLERMGPSL